MACFFSLDQPDSFRLCAFASRPLLLFFRPLSGNTRCVPRTKCDSLTSTVPSISPSPTITKVSKMFALADQIAITLLHAHFRLWNGCWQHEHNIHSLAWMAISDNVKPFSDVDFWRAWVRLAIILSSVLTSTVDPTDCRSLPISRPLSGLSWCFSLKFHTSIWCFTRCYLFCQLEANHRRQQCGVAFHYLRFTSHLRVPLIGKL